MRAWKSLVCVFFSMMVACGDDSTPGRTDSGQRADTGTATDSGTATDTGTATDSGTATDTGTATDSGTPTDAGPATDAGMCVDPRPLASRPAAVECSSCRPPSDPTMIGRGLCMADADCTMGMNGRCVPSRIGGECSYDTCFKDQDCMPDQLCACDGGFGGGNGCIEAGCHTDADCSGSPCSPSLGDCGHYTPPVGYYCHGASDTCGGDADCGGGYCAYNPMLGHWACSMAECVG